MKMYRGGRTSSKWQVTDSKDMKQWAKDWNPEKTLTVDGTVTKYGARHTDLGLRLTADDIAALHDGLLRFQNKRIKQLEKESAAQRATIALLEQALKKMWHLTVFHKHKAPNEEVFIDTLSKIADHFQHGYTRKDPIDLGWIKWKSI